MWVEVGGSEWRKGGIASEPLKNFEPQVGTGSTEFHTCGEALAFYSFVHSTSIY